MGFQGKNARADEEPAAYELRQQAATGKNKRAKTASTMPFTTADVQNYAEEYVAISDALAPVFEWLRTAVGFYLSYKINFKFIISAFSTTTTGNRNCRSVC